MQSDYIVDGNKIVGYTGDGGDIIIPDGVTQLDELCFTKLVHRKEYDNDGNVKEYKAYNFDIKNNIKSIYIPNSVKLIDEETFSDLVNLEKVTFQSGSQIKEIPRFAFSGCKSLKNITIPESVTYIDSFAFSHCSNITVNVGKDCKVSDSVFGYEEETKEAKIVYPKIYDSNNFNIQSDTKNSHTLMGFCVIMIFVYFVLFIIIGFVIDSVELTWLIIVLGITNLILLFVSFWYY